MSTLFSTPQKRAAFDTRVHAQGLDKNRCDTTRMKGIWRASDAAQFRQGAPVMLDSTGQVVLADGTKSVLGAAAWGKVSLGQSAVIDYPVTLPGTTTVSVLSGVSHAPIANVKVSATAGGAPIAATSNYTLSTANATLTRIGGAISDGQTVYVSYTYELVESDYLFEGKNFWASNDYVTIQDNRIAVIEAPADIFTMEYDPAATVPYALTGAGSNIYVTSAGVFSTASAGSAHHVGYCINVPTNADPYLGIRFIGQTGANA